MKCIRCGAKAAVDLRRHNAGFCPEHFLAHFEQQVVRTLDRFGMLAPGDRILVAVSGGKDSLVLWDVLHRLGHPADGLYVDLGIDGYSDRSREKAERFAHDRGLSLEVVSLEAAHGLTVPEAARRTRRPACASCGLSKRWVFNERALAGGYDVLATGHNLDDEVAALLGNVLRWSEGHLGRQQPVLPARDGHVRKIKPLVRQGERESAAYAFLRGIDYVLEECPLAEGARSLTMKAALAVLEADSPAVKQEFYDGFLARGRPHFESTEGRRLSPCQRCGQPTAVELCAFCRLKERLAPAPASPRPSPESP